MTNVYMKLETGERGTISIEVGCSYPWSINESLDITDISGQEKICEYLQQFLEICLQKPLHGSLEIVEYDDGK